MTKLEIIIARFLTGNQLLSFHLRTQIAWVQAVDYNAEKCLVLILSNKSGFSEGILLTIESHQRMNCAVLLV